MINTLDPSRYAVITRTSVSHLAIFIVSLFLLMPLLGIATSGVNDSPEELESLSEVSYTHTSTSMNEPGFQKQSIFTDSSVDVGGNHACLITDDNSNNSNSRTLTIPTVTVRTRVPPVQSQKPLLKSSRDAAAMTIYK